MARRQPGRTVPTHCGIFVTIGLRPRASTWDDGATNRQYGNRLDSVQNKTRKMPNFEVFRLRQFVKEGPRSKTGTHDQRVRIANIFPTAQNTHNQRTFDAAQVDLLHLDRPTASIPPPFQKSAHVTQGPVGFAKGLSFWATRSQEALVGLNDAAGHHHIAIPSPLLAHGGANVARKGEREERLEHPPSPPRSAFPVTHSLLSSTRQIRPCPRPPPVQHTPSVLAILAPPTSATTMVARMLQAHGHAEVLGVASEHTSAEMSSSSSPDILSPMTSPMTSPLPPPVASVNIAAAHDGRSLGGSGAVRRCRSGRSSVDGGADLAALQSTPAPTFDTRTSITAMQLGNELLAGGDFLLLDVRSIASYQRGHVQGALSVACSTMLQR